MATQRAAKIGEAALQLAALPEEDLPLVFELLDVLKERHSRPQKPLSAPEIRELAKGRARLLQDVPRDALMARFLELGEEIRRQAIAKGTAVDGDWESD